MGDADTGAVGLRIKADGLRMLSFRMSLSLEPFDRLAKEVGSTFSESSVSINSAFRLPPVGKASHVSEAQTLRISTYHFAYS
jgi:hypothetical protein